MTNRFSSFPSPTKNCPTVEGFLKKRPISGWVERSMARKNALHKAYGFESVPVMVLIDAEGRVAAITHPTALEAHHLEDPHGSTH